MERRDLVRVPRALTVLGLAAWLASADAAAQTRPPDAPAAEREDRAVAVFEESEKRYREGKFKEAVDLLLEAYRLSPEPPLLYNLGRAYEGMGDLERARDAYRRYLDADRGASDRGAIEQRIATLTRQLDERAALQRQRDAAARGPAAAPATEAAGPSPVPWIIAGAGGAALAAGVVFGILTRSKHADAVDEKAQTKARSLQDDADTFATVANVAFVGGGVLAAGGIAWGLVDLATSRPRGVGAMVTVGGHF